MSLRPALLYCKLLTWFYWRAPRPFAQVPWFCFGIQMVRLFFYVHSYKKSNKCQELPVWSKSLHINNVVIIKIVRNCCTESVLVLFRRKEEEGKWKLQTSVQDLLKRVEEVSRKRWESVKELLGNSMEVSGVKEVSRKYSEESLI